MHIVCMLSFENPTKPVVEIRTCEHIQSWAITRKLAINALNIVILILKYGFSQFDFYNYLKDIPKV